MLKLMGKKIFTIFFEIIYCYIIWDFEVRNPVFGGFVNNKGADQPAHPRSLISALFIRFLESIISRLATSKISIFLLVSVAEQAGLNLTLLETPKTGFVA